MFGNFPFGQGQFGQPDFEGSASISGSCSVTQQSQTCSGSGHVIGGEAPGIDQKWIDWFLKKRSKRKSTKPEPKVTVQVQRIVGLGQLTQESILANAVGSLSFSASGRCRLKKHKAASRGRVSFVGAGSIGISRSTMAASCRMSFTRDARIGFRRKPDLTEEELAILLLSLP